MNQATARQLIEKYLHNTLSGEERQQLLDMTNDSALASLLQQMLAEDVIAGLPIDEQRRNLSLSKVLEVDRPVKVRKLQSSRFRYAAAAVILLIAGMGAYIWSQNRQQQDYAIHTPATEAVPGGKKAVLTLSDGTTIQLDSTANGQLATQQGSQVQNKNGQIIYTPGSNDESVLVYNTLRTPRGGVYQLVLPDGTRVWLNAASSISYPVAFRGKERSVSITGEAYFEVAQHAQMPFSVTVNEANVIEVLGTHFNVKAYSEEELISTTLLEGAVRVNSHGKSIALQPGQQAQASAQQLKVKALQSNGIAEAMAWKEGRFNFQDASLQEIMRQLSRWYDIEVVYEKGIPDLEFIGEVERSLPLSEVLKGLKMSGVNYRLEKGKRLIVSP